MQLRKITTEDAAFLSEIFSVPEYEMYFAENDTTQEDWQKRYMGYGNMILSDLIAANPNVKRIKLDVQKRNIPALTFYRKHGFIVEGEEMQPVGESEEPYFKLLLVL